MSAVAAGDHLIGSEPANPAERVAQAARLLARAGLVEAFGHVSARRHGGGFAITATTPMLHARAADVIELDAEGCVRCGDEALCPKEASLHAEIYAVRPDVGAICRTHSPAVVVWASRGELPPLVHGLGALSGALAFHDDPQLVTSTAAGRSAAVALADADCLLLYANGAVCSAPDLPGAVVRAWFLEERARVAESVGRGRALSSAQAAERAAHCPAEGLRAWQWLRANFAGDQANSRSIIEPPGGAA